MGDRELGAISRKKIFVWALVLILIMSLVASYIHFRMLQIENTYHDEFKANLINVTENENDFYMQDISPFKWDRMHIIRPYSTVTEMHNKVGLKWTTRKSYLGYLWDKIVWEDYHLDDDRFHKLVFVKGGKVILDITLDREAIDFMLMDEVINYNEDYFIIEKTNRGKAKMKPLNFIGDSL